MHFGDLLRRYRLAADLSQEALAARAGLSARGISALERGVNRTPQRETVVRLADALALSGEERSAFLTAAQQRATRTGAATRAEPHAPSALPAPLTALLGREEEVRDLTGLLHRMDVRLVTLTGAGGVGKTRLALAVAAAVSAAFPDGVAFVSLASLRDAALVLPAAAQSLGLRGGGSRSPLKQLTTHLRARRVLLVLDNCEHLPSAVPEVARLLESCPRLTVLATSRARLRLRGEREVQVEPLAVPDLRRVSSPEALGRYPAVALFVERMREQRPQFALTAANAIAVVEVCARVEGLPLALELAAAQGRLFSPRALLARLERRLVVLTGGPRDLPARQQTMRDTIAWSYDLLHAGEQVLLRRLAVFAGGCTLEAIEAVCAATGGQAADALEWVRSLAEKSLLRSAESSDGATRFAMLETIREFALERLTLDDALEPVRRAHAAHFLATATQAEAALFGPEQGAWLARLQQDHDNLRAALRWSIHEGGDPALGLRLACALGRFWLMCGYYREGRAWLEQALAQSPAADAGLRSTALTLVGHLAFWLDDLGQAQTAYEETLALRRAEGDPGCIGVALSHVGNIAFEQEDYARAQVLYEESLALAEQAGDKMAWARVLNNLGVLAQIRGDLEQALAAYERCSAFWRERGDMWSLATQLTNIGDVVRLLAEPARARNSYRESLILRRDLGDRDGAAWTLRSLGYLLHQLGDHEHAARMLGAAAAMTAQLGSGIAAHMRPLHEQQIEEIRGQLGDETFAAAWADGQHMEFEEALAYALTGQR